MNTYKFKITVPDGSTIYAAVGDKTKNLLIYDFETYDVFEDIRVNFAEYKLNVRDGQYINKGEVLCYSGLFGYKRVISDFSGIVEISNNHIRILGQKKKVSRRLNLIGRINSINANKYIIIKCKGIKYIPPLYFVKKKSFSSIITWNQTTDIVWNTILSNVTIHLNFSVYQDDLAKVISLGASKIIVNSLIITELNSFYKLLNSLESFAVLFGFSEFVRPDFLIDDTYDVFWGSEKLFFTPTSMNTFNNKKCFISEHPFWGIRGKINKRKHYMAEITYNDEIFDIYYKNVR